ncbi:hypothetical protein ACIOWI_36730 [Streptomyces sp. NPDC087659]|uniref:hypothetical protein n=1 Tax=Streptomyces sp. NPDC087659 TaxID=3365801 RepID=UPI0038291197
MSTDPRGQRSDDPASPTGSAGADRDMEVDAYAYASEEESIQVAGPVRPVPHAADAGTGAPDPRHIPAPSDSAIHALNDRAHQLWVAFHDDTAPPDDPLARTLPPLPGFITAERADELFRVLNDPANELATFGGVRDHIESKYGHACTIAELDILQNHCDHHALGNPPPNSIKKEKDPKYAEALRQWPTYRLHGVLPILTEKVELPGRETAISLGRRFHTLRIEGVGGLPLGELAELRRWGMRPRWVHDGEAWKWKVFAPMVQELAFAISGLFSVPDRTYVDTSGRVPLHVGAVFHQLETIGVCDLPGPVIRAVQTVLKETGKGRRLEERGGVWRLLPAPGADAGSASSASAPGTVAGSGSRSGRDFASALQSGLVVGRVDTSESMSRSLAQLVLDAWFRPYGRRDVKHAVLLRRAWALWSGRPVPGAGQSTNAPDDGAHASGGVGGSGLADAGDAWILSQPPGPAPDPARPARQETVDRSTSTADEPASARHRQAPSVSDTLATQPAKNAATRHTVPVRERVMAALTGQAVEQGLHAAGRVSPPSISASSNATGTGQAKGPNREPGEASLVLPRGPVPATSHPEQSEQPEGSGSSVSGVPGMLAGHSLDDLVAWVGSEVRTLSSTPGATPGGEVTAQNVKDAYRRLTSEPGRLPPGRLHIPALATRIAFEHLKPGSRPALPAGAPTPTDPEQAGSPNLGNTGQENHDHDLDPDDGGWIGIFGDDDADWNDPDGGDLLGDENGAMDGVGAGWGVDHDGLDGGISEAAWMVDVTLPGRGDHLVQLPHTIVPLHDFLAAALAQAGDESAGLPDPTPSASAFPHAGTGAREELRGLAHTGWATFSVQGTWQRPAGTRPPLSVDQTFDLFHALKREEHGLVTCGAVWEYVRHHHGIELTTTNLTELRYRYQQDDTAGLLNPPPEEPAAPRRAGQPTTTAKTPQLKMTSQEIAQGIDTCYERNPEGLRPPSLATVKIGDKTWNIGRWFENLSSRGIKGAPPKVVVAALQRAGIKLIPHPTQPGYVKIDTPVQKFRFPDEEIATAINTWYKNHPEYVGFLPPQTATVKIGDKPWNIGKRLRGLGHGGLRGPLPKAVADALERAGVPILHHPTRTGFVITEAPNKNPYVIYTDEEWVQVIRQYLRDHLPIAPPKNYVMAREGTHTTVKVGRHWDGLRYQGWVVSLGQGVEGRHAAERAVLEEGGFTFDEVSVPAKAGDGGIGKRDEVGAGAVGEGARQKALKLRGPTPKDLVAAIGQFFTDHDRGAWPSPERVETVAGDHGPVAVRVGEAFLKLATTGVKVMPKAVEKRLASVGLPVEEQDGWWRFTRQRIEPDGEKQMRSRWRVNLPS